MPPFFSIVIPVFNLENCIQTAIDSVINQSFQDYELIIINDGSSDNTSSVIKKYINNNKIKTIEFPKNESLHISRIEGINTAVGKYILFLDGDDSFTENALDIISTVINTNPNHDIYEFAYRKKPVDEIVLPFRSPQKRFYSFFDKNAYPPPTVWNKAYDNSLLKKALLFMERDYINNAEDFYESIIIAYFLKNICYSNQIIINYTIGTGISTTYKDYKKTIDFMLSAKKTIDLINGFLLKINENINLSFLSSRLIDFVFFYINSQKHEDDRNRLIEELPKMFNAKIILDYMYFREEKIYNSKDYKLGKLVLYPLRKLKKLFHNNKPSCSNADI